MQRCDSLPPLGREEPKSNKKRVGQGGDNDSGSFSVLPLLWQEFMGHQGFSWGRSGGGWGGATKRVLEEVGECGGGGDGGGNSKEGGLRQGRRSKRGEDGGAQRKLEAREWERHQHRHRQDGSLHRASVWDWEMHKGVAVYVVEVETLGQKDARKVFRR